MADYVATLKNDLVEQFRGKANIEALMEVIGAQLQQVYDFYDQLRQDRGEPCTREISPKMPLRRWSKNTVCWCKKRKRKTGRK